MVSDTRQESNALNVAAIIIYSSISLVCIVGIVCNLLTITVIFVTKLAKATPYTYLAALAVSNGVYLLVMLPLAISRTMWAIEHDACSNYAQMFVIMYLSIPIGNASAALSTWIILAVTLERFLFVQYPMKARANHNPNINYYLLCSLVIVSILFHIPYYFMAAPMADPYTSFGMQLSTTRKAGYNTAATTGVAIICSTSTTETKVFDTTTERYDQEMDIDNFNTNQQTKKHLKCFTCGNHGNGKINNYTNMDHKQRQERDRKECFTMHFPQYTEQPWQNIYFWTRAMLVQVIPWILLSLFNLLLVRTYKKTRKEVILISASNVTNSATENRLTLMLVVIIFESLILDVTCSITNYATSETIFGKNITNDSMQILAMIENVCETMNCCADFVIYCLLNKNFYRELKSLIRHCKFKSGKVVPANNSPEGDHVLRNSTPI